MRLAAAVAYDRGTGCMKHGATRAGVMGIALLCVLSIAPSCAAPRTDARARAGDFVDVTIDVTESGQHRSATLNCGKQNRSSGYLARWEARSAACVTAFINHENSDFLSQGRRPAPGGCAAQPSRRQGARARIVGTYAGERIRREVHAQNACDDALWDQLLPLLEPRPHPVLPTNPD